MLGVGVTVALAGTPLSAQGTGAPEVTLRPGDAIDVRIVADADLSGVCPVDERGMVTLPLVGTRLVTGAVWSVVRDSLLAAFARELRYPSVQLTPMRRIPILGHVNKAGVQLLDPAVTLAGAIAMAQGASPDGDLRKVRVVRDGITLLEAAPVDATVFQLDLRSGDQVVVGRRSWWDRNSGAVVGAVISAVTLLVTAGR
ncbi:MAG: hypothetical protein RL139_128 [Gemmatimonadota bacterium]|jgi:protein involved in polysaccharide export with SLBB domain